jgi:hypothetical protein
MLSLVEFLLSLRDVDVGVLQSIHFHIDVGEGADLLLQQAQNVRNLILLVERNEEDQLLRCGVIAFFYTHDAALSLNDIFDLGLCSLELSETLHALSLGFKQEVIADSKAFLNVVRSV